jgi:hypothetical protein
MMISSIIVALPGISSLINPGASCPLDCGRGLTGFDQ